MSNLATHLKLFTVAVIWGFGWPAGRVVANDILPFTASWIRYIIAVSCFLIFLKVTDRWQLPSRGQWKIVVLIGFFSTCVYQAFFMYGMKYTAAGDASLMITFNPIFTALLAIPFLSEKMNIRLGSGLILGLIGVFVLFFYSPNIDIPFGDRLKGNFLIAGAALAWALSSILMKKSMTESKEPLSPLLLTVWSSVTGLLILTPWAAYEIVTVGFTNPSQDAWISIVFLAIFSTVLSYVWFADGIKTLGAGRSALYIYLVPPFGILSAWILIDEKIGWAFVVSFLLIVVGVALAQSEKRDEQDVSGH